MFSHYNDYRYNPENETFENIEDGHNIIEAFTRDIMSDYGGYPDFSTVCNKHANIEFQFLGSTLFC